MAATLGHTPSVERSATDVIVIGAGHNGLVAACYLARTGLKVLVVEAADVIGGMTFTAPLIPEAPEHQINACAIDALAMRASTIVADLELHRFGYREIEVDPWVAGVDPDGASIGFWRDPERTADEIRRFSKPDAEAWLEFSRTLDAAMGMVLPVMATNPMRPTMSSVLAAARGAARHPRQFATLAKIVTSSTAEVIDERFSHPIVRGALAVMCGVLPITERGSGSALLVWGLNHRVGSGRPVGGTGALPAALRRALEAAGGQVRTSAAVDELLVRKGRVTGVRLTSGEELTARAVVAACDPRTTLTELLPAGTLSSRLEARAAKIPTTNLGAVSLKVDVAFSGRLNPARHNSARSDGLDLRRPYMMIGTLEEMVTAYEHVSAGTIPDFIPFVSTVPTAADPTQAPEGQDTLYIFIGWVAAQTPEAWDQITESTGKAVLADAARYYGGIDELEIGRWVEAWPALASRTRAPDGNVYHVDVVASRMGPLRPALGFGGYKTPTPGLFLTGAGTHPTPGVAGIPGQLAAQVVLRKL
jgi:phytoene dehydrogenase-like protein